MRSLRTFLILGRVSNLPTVWSNCLAGWWLGGGGNLHLLSWLLIGATLLYLGGMFLNDAMDAGFDAQHRRERPIPSGAVRRRTVWQFGLLQLAVGAIILIFCGGITGFLAVVLLLCIVIYDAVHKWITFSPVLMAACRFLLYPMAASVGVDGVTGWSLWCGLALAFYIAGLSYLARRESARGPMSYWPCLLLAAPVLLAVLMNTGQYLRTAVLLSLVLGLWVVRCLRYTLWSPSPNIGRTVSGLLAGIVIVDLLAATDAPPLLSLTFVVLFILALLFQRFVPAT